MFSFLTDKFSSVFSYLTGQKYLTEKNIAAVLQQVKDALLSSDVPCEVVDTFVCEVQDEVVGKKILSNLKAHEQFAHIMHKKLTALLGENNQIPTLPRHARILVMGLQGSGKTTTVAKLATFFSAKQQKKLLVSSVDFQRPAAREQLAILARKAAVQCYTSSALTALGAVDDLLSSQEVHKADGMILDTAGRLHIDQPLINELQAIVQIYKPTHKYLVVDAMIGQQLLAVAQVFQQGVGIDGIIISKIDSEAPSGAVLAFAYMLKKPVLFMGTGEKIDDFELFRPERIASRILGMGDLQGLLEKAEEKISQHERERAQRTVSDKMTLQDFADQLAMMNRLGPLSSLARYIPGISASMISDEQMEVAQKETKRFGAIISSMTMKERLNHRILNESRKKRIARGAGVSTADINVLLKRFEEMQQFAKLFKKMGTFKNF